MSTSRLSDKLFSLIIIVSIKYIIFYAIYIPSFYFILVFIYIVFDLNIFVCLVILVVFKDIFSSLDGVEIDVRPQSVDWAWVFTAVSQVLVRVR